MKKLENHNKQEEQEEDKNTETDKNNMNEGFDFEKNDENPETQQLDELSMNFSCI